MKLGVNALIAEIGTIEKLIAIAVHVKQKTLKNN